MALFKFNYDKPGKGVEKDEPEQTALAKFFTTFFRRFSKFVQLNLIFMIPCILVIVLMFGVSILPVPRYIMRIGNLATPVEINLYDRYVTTLPLILLSPFLGGVLVVVRRLVNREYCFIWSEFWKGVKDNWKQFLINGVVCYIAYALLTFAIEFYASKLGEGWFNFIPFALILILSVLFVFSQMYAPLMMVSVNMKTFHIYKNALIFSIMGLFRNFLIAIIYIAMIIVYIFLVPYMNITLLLGILALILLVPIFLTYTSVYITYPLIDNNVIKPFYKKKEEVEGPPAPDPVALTYNAEELEENKSEYVYVNGRLVNKDELKDDLDS